MAWLIRVIQRRLLSLIMIKMGMSIALSSIIPHKNIQQVFRITPAFGKNIIPLLQVNYIAMMMGILLM